MRTSQSLARLMLGSSLIAPLPAMAWQVQPPAVPAVHKHIYPEIADGAGDVQAALTRAKAEHKRVLMIFGGDWCGDCQVLDINMHQADNEALLSKYFEVVHVNVGHMDRNVELAQRYGVPLKEGVPAVSVVESNGTVVHAQATGEFKDMRHMDPRSVNEFLEQWKA